MITDSMKSVASVVAETTAKSDEKTKIISSYGKTIGEPKLSETAEKYYEELKKKFHNLDFILVSSDQKENAKSQAASYGNASKMVVLIDEEKIEKMATDPEYRKQYEALIERGSSGLSQLKDSIQGASSNVLAYGMQINDGGTASFFAVLKKSSAAQKERIEQKRQEAIEERRAEAKEDAKERLEKIRDGSKTEEEEDVEILYASSVEELMSKISDYEQNLKMNTIRTPEEMMVGTHIDFRG